MSSSTTLHLYGAQLVQLSVHHQASVPGAPWVLPPALRSNQVQSLPVSVPCWGNDWALISWLLVWQQSWCRVLALPPLSCRCRSPTSASVPVRLLGSAGAEWCPCLNCWGGDVSGVLLPFPLPTLPQPPLWSISLCMCVYQDHIFLIGLFEWGVGVDGRLSKEARLCLSGEFAIPSSGTLK